MDKTWLETCLTAGEFLYGEFPVSVLQKLYATKGGRVTDAEIMEFYDESYMMLCDGETFSPLIATEGEMLRMFKEADAAGNPYASLHFDLDELKELRKGHKIVADQDYWMPTSSQIEELVEQGYISSPAMEKLESEIKRRGGDPEYLKGIWGRLSTEKLDQFESINAVMSGAYPTAHKYKDYKEGDELPEEVLAQMPTMDDLNALLPLVNEFLNNINLRSRKGWRPQELFKKQYPHGMTQMPTIMPGSASFAKTLKEAEPQLRAEDKARKITDTAELMFLHSFQAKQHRPEDFAFDWERSENGADEDGEAVPEAAHVTAAHEPQVQTGRPEKPDKPIKLGGYWGKVAAGQGIEVAETDRSDTVAATEPETSAIKSDQSETELEQVKAELAQARKQLKGLRTALNNEKHAADADRAKYEHELKSLRMEYRELADLRSLVFNREAEDPTRLEKVEKQYAYPYETRKRTVAFGGHDTFLKAIKPMLPTVKFVDANNLTFNADIIRNADVVWVQNNCISHSQFWNIVKNCKQAEVQMRYFGFASAEKCAEQLVTEDQK